MRNHLQGLAEGMKILGWVYTDKPITHVKDSMDSGLFYLTKVQMEYKSKEGGQIHTGFVQAYKDLCINMQAYVKEFHLSGLFFNPNGKELKE